MYSMSPHAGKLLSDEESINKYNTENHWGLHIAVDLGECDHQKISDGEVIKQFAIDLADYIEMKRYGEPIAVHFGDNPKVLSPRTPTGRSSTCSPASSSLRRRPRSSAKSTSAPRRWNTLPCSGTSDFKLNPGDFPRLQHHPPVNVATIVMAHDIIVRTRPNFILLRPRSSPVM